jgi:hypothetical protein
MNKVALIDAQNALRAETFKVNIADDSSDSWDPNGDDDYKDVSELLSYFESFKKVA